MIGLDSFIGEVYGYEKQGAGYGYTRKLGYHPIIATRCDTGEVFHIRNRKGKANTQRGAERFVDELLARVRRTAHRGLIMLRADSGFENHKLMLALERQGVEFSIPVKQTATIKALIDGIAEQHWTGVPDYPETGEAHIAETKLGPWRLIVRRTRLLGAQAELWPDWRYHCFVINRTVPILIPDVDHRDHATVELTIRDLRARPDRPRPPLSSPRDPRKAHPHKPPMDPPPPRALAMEDRLHHRARRNPRAARARLTSTSDPRNTPHHHHADTGRSTPPEHHAPRFRGNASAPETNLSSREHADTPTETRPTTLPHPPSQLPPTRIGGSRPKAASPRLSVDRRSRRPT